MDKIEKLNRKMIELEYNGDIEEEEYATYRNLLLAVEALNNLTLMAEYFHSELSKKHSDVVSARKSLCRLEIEA